MKLEILARRAGRRVPRAFLKNWIRASAAELKKRGVRMPANELTLVFVSAPEIKALNARYRGKESATDVLSFSASNWEPQSLGELVLCLPVIDRQAQEHRHSFREELGYMVLHGILHLLGYEHEKSTTQARRMFQLQDAVFESLCRKRK